MLNEKAKILIIRLSAIGDTVHSLPVATSLKKSFPNSYLGWVVEDRSAEIIINNPAVDKVFVMPKTRWRKQGLNFKTLKEIIDFFKEIRKENFEIALDLQELFKSAIVMFFSGAKRRIAHAKTREFAYLFANEHLPAMDNFVPNFPIIKRYLEFAKHLGADVGDVKFQLPPATDEIKSKIDNLLKNVDKPIAILNPSTIWQTKHWLEKNWAELADELAKDYGVIFTGVEKDKALIARINNNNHLSLAGETSISELIELFRRAEITIAPDTGPAHIAAAAGVRKVITIFGATSYKRSAPYGHERYALSADLACQPCFRRKCKLKNEMECMQQINIQDVLERVTTLNKL